LIRKILEEAIVFDTDLKSLLCGLGICPAAIDSRGSRRSNLRYCVRAYFNGHFQMIPAQHAAGQIVQMDQRPAIIHWKRAHHAQRRLLLAFSEDCLLAVSTRLESQPQMTINSVTTRR
jgi:hypothetical protein